MTVRRSPLRNNGFTLIEVLVAMFIMAILAVMAWQGVDGIVNARTASQSRMEQLLRLNSVLAQLQQDLEALQDSGALPQPMPAFDGISLRLTRRTETGVQLVVWSLRGGTWLRWTGNPVTTTRALQDQWMNSQQFIGNETGQLRTVTGIAEWQAYCFRDNAWSNCQSSAGNAAASPSPAASAPPPAPTDPLKALRVVINFAEGSGFTGSVTRDFALGPQ
jgi:general secretion pathway protein J